MATQTRTDVLALEIGVLEALPVDLRTRPAARRAYPYPPLQATGQNRRAEVPVIVLENDYLAAFVAPQLGGRLLRIVDKASGRNVMDARNRLEPEPGGPRGFTLRDGLQVHVGEGPRLNAMGPVQFSIEEPKDAEEPGSVWIAERVSPTSIGFHARYSLPPASAWIELEVRAFNRSLRPTPYSGWVEAWMGDGAPCPCVGGIAAYDQGRGVGMGLFGDPTAFDVADFRSGVLRIGRFPNGVCEWLGPRQLDCWALRVVPFAGMKSIDAASAFATLGVDKEEMTVRATRDMPGSKLIVLCERGETVEARLDLSPAKALPLKVADLPGPPKVVVLKDAQGVELLRWERSGTQTTASSAKAQGSVTMAALRQAETGTAQGRERAYFEGLDLMAKGEYAVDALSRATTVPALRAPAGVALGMCALRIGDWKEAAASLGDALTYNAEDHLCWWLKAHAQRLAGDAEPDDQELPNAHYLAPLEPALRAEAYLSQPISPEAAPTPLLRPIADDVEAWVEVACLLIDAGLYDEAARWLDEGLRHREQSRLRYLMAYVCLASAKAEVDAGRHVALATQSPLTPPYPWQPVELQALETLAARFPVDEGLAATGDIVRSLYLTQKSNLRAFRGNSGSRTAGMNGWTESTGDKLDRD